MDADWGKGIALLLRDEAGEFSVYGYNLIS